MNAIEFRDKARSCLAKAKALLATGDDADLNYACLELRIALEALVYEMFQRYLIEVSASAMDAWTPKKVLGELTYVDPNVEGDVHLSIELPATENRPKQTIFLGTEYRLSAKSADRMHNALSSFLHHPTIKQLNEEDPKRPQKQRDKANEILTELEKVLTSSLSSFKAHRMVTITCTCGCVVGRDVGFLEAGKEVICSNCGCRYDYQLSVEKGAYAFSVRMAKWTCVKCHTVHEIPSHEALNGTGVRCNQCAAEYAMMLRLRLEPLGKLAGSDG